MEKVLVIQTAFLGDAVLTLPMIQKLKEILPGCSLDVIAIPSTAEIFSASPYVDNVVVIDKKGKHKSLPGLLNFIFHLKKNKYTRVYSPHRSFRTALIVLMLGVKQTYGFSSSSLKFLYKHLVAYIPEHHEVQRNLDLIGYDYKGEWKILPEVIIPGQAENKINEFLSANNLNSKIVVIAPGSVWETKKYPSNYFKDLVKYFHRKEYGVVLIGGEKDKKLCSEIAGVIGEGVVSSAGEFSIIETICLMKKSKIVVSNDSAPTHFAMCADVPALTIYCSTVPEFGFSPYNSASSFVSLNGLICKPCGIHGYNECPIKTFECGFNLLPQTVISKIEELINDNG